MNDDMEGVVFIAMFWPAEQGGYFFTRPSLWREDVNDGGVWRLCSSTSNSYPLKDREKLQSFVHLCACERVHTGSLASLAVNHTANMARATEGRHMAHERRG